MQTIHGYIHVYIIFEAINIAVTLSRKALLARNGEGRGYLVVVTGSTWLLRGLRACYGVYVPLLFVKIALRHTAHTGRN